jgi:AraC family transcriptional regulator, transcriptional activator FtrA
MSKSVAILGYDRLCLFEYALAADILRDRSGQFGEENWYKTCVVSVEPGQLRTEHGLLVDLELAGCALEAADTVIVPGWRLPDPVPDEIVAAIRKAHNRGARIASICTGSFVLAAAGLLNGRRATTHWRDCEQLQREYPEVDVDQTVLYVDNGDVMTSAGSAAGIDMLLHMIWQDFGPETCNAVARMMVVPPHRDGGQAQFVLAPVLPVANLAFKRVMEKIRHEPAGTYSITDMAGDAAMSVRTFHRAFKAATGVGPYEWLLRERVRRARELLIETDEDMGWIAAHSGFSSPEALRPVFRRIVGTTPSDYRRTFRVDPHALASKGA